MIFSRRFKVILLLFLLVVISGGVGFFLGIGIAGAVAKKKGDPEFWNEAALSAVEKLHPTDEQREKFRRRIDQAVEEAVATRDQTIDQAWGIVDRLVNDIDKELTPAQREIFAKMKPKRDQTTLNMLKVKRRPKEEKESRGQSAPPERN